MTATHIDAWGAPVAYSGDWSFHPTPCCGAGVSIDEDGATYCKACFAEVDPSLGGVPVEPIRERTTTQ